MSRRPSFDTAYVAKLEVHHDHNLSCPYCRKQLTVSEALLDKNTGPKPGDFTVCAECGTILRYGEGLACLVESTEGEIAAMDDESRRLLKRVQHWVRNR